jgi:2-methylisocitrate lyase-like PEP mutase family enzyme
MAASHARICAAVDVPVIGDADTGFGGLMNVVRTVQEYERAGVAAMHLEDQLTPKRPPTSGEVNDTITRREMVDKIRAAVDAREDPSLFIIARSEVHGDPDEVVARLQECVAAGADGAWISVHEAEDVRRLRAEIDAPLIGVLPRGMSLDEYASLGANCALLPTWLDTVAINAKRHLLSEMLATGTGEGFLSELEGLDGDRSFVQGQGQDELRRLEQNFS